jgi:hypothetical protein
MTLADLVALASDFDTLAPRDKICLLAWHLHVHRGVEIFGNAQIRACFREIDAIEPAISGYLPQMADKRTPDLVRSRGGYRLERAVRAALDKKYGQSPATVAVTKLLADLPAKVPDIAERAFLQEALDCYKVCAYRAATIMTWNLAFDHLVRWVLADGKRLAAFNTALSKRFPKKAALSIARITDFEELKESEIIDVCGTAALFSHNVVEILREKLKRRNIAAHPSSVVVTQPQADDAITDLVNNVVLALV